MLESLKVWSSLVCCGLVLVLAAACAPITPIAPQTEVPSAEESVVDGTVMPLESGAPALNEGGEITGTVAVTVSASITNNAEEVGASAARTAAFVVPPYEFPVFDNLEEYVEAGRAEYRAQYCGVCHALTEVGTRGPFGPNHDEVATTAEKRLQDENYSGAATTVAEYLYESIVDPYVYVVPGFEGTAHRMPPYFHLSEEQLKGLVAFLLTQEQK